jgi:hypothetical protein
VFYEIVPIMPYKGELAPIRDKYICAISGGGKEFPSVMVDGRVYESLFQARRFKYLEYGKLLHLYGNGWMLDTPENIEIRDKCEYMGECKDKIHTMSQYHAAIVYENTDKTYTSEKYWDAVQSGCDFKRWYRGEIPEYPIEHADYRNWAKRIVKHLEEVS